MHIDAKIGEQEIHTLTTIGENGFDSFACSTGIGG